MTWLLTAPLLVLGLLAGHSLGYRWTIPDAHERAHMLEASGHGYLEYAPLVVSVALTVAFVALAARVLAVVRARPCGVPPWLFALLAPLAFVVQEYVERWRHSGDVAWPALLEPPVLAGLLVQLPVALVVLAIARALSRLADAFGRALGAEPPGRLANQLIWSPRGAMALVAPSVAARGWSERGPPAPAG